MMIKSMTATNNNRPLAYTQLNDSPQLRQFGWTRKLLYLAVASVLIALLLKALTPTQVEEQAILQKNYNNTVSQFNNVTYSGDVVLIPKKLPVVETKTITIETNAFINTFLTNFSLTADPAPEKGSTYPQIYSSLDYKLYILPESNTFQLVSKNPPPSGVVGEQKALATAQEIVDKLYPDAKLQPLLAHVSLGSSAGGEVVPTTSDKADIAAIPFTIQAANLPVYSGQSLNPVVVVWINSSNKLQKLQAETTYLSASAQRSYDTITYTQALRNINDDQASIASSIYLDPGQVSYDQITAGSLNSAGVEYHTDPETGEAVPYYRFSGDLTDAQNKTFQAEVITPAIQTKFSN